MSICLPCAIRRRRNCQSCAALAPIPDHQRVARAARSMVSDYRANDPGHQEAIRKAAEYQLKEEMRAARQESTRNAWRRHDRRIEGGKQCDLSACPCARSK